MDVATITKFYKEAPILKFTQALPKDGPMVLGLPEFLVGYINSQTKKSASQRTLMMILLGSMDYNTSRAEGLAPKLITEKWLCQIMGVEARNLRESELVLIEKGWIGLKIADNSVHVLIVDTKKLLEEASYLDRRVDSEIDFDVLMEA